MKPRILFADDEASIRDLVALYFRKRGYEVTTVLSGKDAMALADTEHFDVAILDISLAGENGLELLSFFRTNFPKLPVIMFTGLTGDDELLEQAMRRGASGFMRKSESLSNLFAAIQAYAPRP